MRPYWFATAALVVVLLFVGLGYADKTRLHWIAEDAAGPRQYEPDRVVGIEIRCHIGGAADLVELFGAECTNPPVASARIFERRKVVTVRTATYSYTVAVSPETQVALGDQWPPK